MGIKKMILIVDDDTIIHESIAAVLSTDEFEILHAYDGHNVLARIKNEQPELIILDIMMPVGDGRDICRDIRANPEMKNIKILMLSAKKEHHERIRGLELGADDYVTKPFNPVFMGNKIRSMCGVAFKPRTQAG